jgi:adenosylmethionine-8-amino-7-oxononanoate aminotransferase
MSLAERDRKYIWHPFTPQKNMIDSIPIAKGKGSVLMDENGNSYIDAVSSWWVNLHGHAHPYIAKKVYKQALQLEQVIFAGFTHKPAIELAERLLRLLPNGFSKIFYSDNGSTSTEVALKMAIQYWWNIEKERRNRNPDTGNRKRNKILAFTNSYHGDTFGAMSVSDRGIFTLAFHDLLFDVIFIETPTTENIKEIKSIVDKHANEIAAFIYEPLVLGAGGMKMYDAVLMDELLRTVKKNRIICIADEVMTGFGRTGKLFASEFMNEKPDIICLSKGLTGGTMALGVTACNEKIYTAYISDDKLKTFFHGHSFTANPLACTAASASMHLLLKKETLQAIEWISNENKKFITELENKFGTAKVPYKNLRSLGTILAFEITQGKDGYLNNISTVITQESLKEGVYLRPLGNTVYIMPPYCITKKQLRRVYDVMLKVVALLTREAMNVH